MAKWLSLDFAHWGESEAKLEIQKVGSEFDFPCETPDRDVALLRLLAERSGQGA
jgi:hypothetical protein